MTYETGGPIQAIDYNTFATLANSVNEVFADLYPGATTLPNAAYGYGQTPALTPVAIGDNVKASEWAALFQAMKNCGTHQGTTVVPPLPASNPVIGDIVTAYNTPLGAVLSTISSLRTNRYNLAPLQSTLITGSNFVQPAGTIPWTDSLVFTCQANFGSWNNARYFFNSGGSLNINGSYSPVVTPDDVLWSTLLNNMSPLVMDWDSTTPSVGIGGTSIGFYGLTTSYQQIYHKNGGGSGYYAYGATTLRVEAKLNAAPGTNGLVDFRISLLDNDVSPATKTSVTTFRIDNKKSSGAIVYPGPAVTVTAVGGTNGFVAV